MGFRSLYQMQSVSNWPIRGVGLLLPSFLQARNADEESASKRRHANAALDGLRGMAALFVFFFHILFSYTDRVEYGYGRDERNTHLIQLPFLRLLIAGHAMVGVFFVVGGYVFSLRPLRLMRSRTYDRLYETVASSLFRRGIRLYLPAIAATFLTMMTIHLGLWEYPRQFADSKDYVFYADNHHRQFPTLFEQVDDWAHETWKLTDIWDYYNKGVLMPYYNPYDPHLWTVPFEYRSSLFLVIVLFAFSKCHTPLRILFMICAIYFCGMWDRWEMVLFLSGTVLAEIKLIGEAADLDGTSAQTPQPMSLELVSSHYSSSALAEPQPPHFGPVPDNEQWTRSSWLRGFRLTTSRRWFQLGGLDFRFPQLPGGLQIRHLLSFVASLYLLSTPNLDVAETPGYRYLSSYTPTTYTDEKRFLQGLGATLLVYTISNSGALQIPFTSHFALYMGRISYSFYIVHGPLIHIVGYSVTPTIWNWIGMEGARWWIGLLLGSVVLAGCVFWVADVFESLVDRSAGKLARKLETWATGAD
ncbi:hypothetical protein P152DRAFT_459554 [Eremomyces bilateralis CBS 781.70]|uniref:Acyltransferase 3 domain-containing protein n=1 Tax=Eremomyces bilateralis CBS 781.70 TaxID=1392243 RepID=A0A6G1G0H8_9PEZI|nr:uncharacterized protein P152DRAFT_459554 [Eremomyces bilateralis CBS 781.70]KAF1811615.1 hypothetical protein P152DRAFT_459554 [Eremomyces bilateralis CBS 781.70]